MPKLLYIGAPLITSLVLLAATLLVFATLRPKDWQIKASIWLALAQTALAALSVAFTYQYSISSQACYTAIFGTMGSLAVAALDTVNLLVWLVRRARAEKTLALPIPILFVLLRLATHAALTSSLWWCAQLCTV